MRKKFITAVLALSCFGVLIVIGSASNRAASVAGFMDATSVLSISETRPTASALTPPRVLERHGSEIPDRVVWYVILSLPEKLEIAAEKARKDNQDDTLWTEYFVRQGNLSSENSQILNDLSKDYMSEIRDIRRRAVSILQEFRRMNPDLATTKTQRPPGIAELIQEKEEITLRFRDRFRDQIGEEAFGQFSEFVYGDFAEGFVEREIERSIPDKVENPGFIPFNPSIPTRDQLQEVTEK